MGNSTDVMQSYQLHESEEDISILDWTMATLYKNKKVIFSFMKKVPYQSLISSHQ